MNIDHDLNRVLNRWTWDDGWAYDYDIPLNVTAVWEDELVFLVQVGDTTTTEYNLDDVYRFIEFEIDEQRSNGDLTRVNFMW